MPPKFLYDRCLPLTVAQILRDAGLDVLTLEDVYGKEQAQRVDDEVWIAHAGQNGMSALTKDKKIRRATVELDAVREHDVVMFALVNGNLPLRQMAAAFLGAVPRILEVIESKPGASIWAVYREGEIRSRWLASRDD